MICLLVRATFVWFVLLCAAVANGLWRELVLLPMLGPSVAHIGSALMLSALIFGMGWALLEWVDVISEREAWIVGCIWLLLTLAFEFVGGHFLFGAPWEKLLEDYNVSHGRIWVLVLITTAFTPLCVKRWKD